MSLNKPVSAMPEGWQPPVPAWSSRPDSGTVVVAYLAAQSMDRSIALAGMLQLSSLIAKSPEAFHVDLALHEPAGRPVDAIAIAYFHDQAAFDRWAQASGFAKWWADDVRLSDPCGYWQERLVLPARRIEALHSSPTRDGHSHGGTLTGPVREHAYWGGMRDRLAASREDRLTPAVEAIADPRTGGTGGRRVVVEAPENLCVIRSGQNLADAVPQEIELYDSVVRPNLIEGMRYLAENGAETGCCDARYVTEIAADGTALPRTFGHCLFLSLGHLEAWAKSHPTHLSIFGSFFQLLKMRDNQLGLKLWHEVAVLPATAQHFEYLNCHPSTGLLGRFDHQHS